MKNLFHAGLATCLAVFLLTSCATGSVTTMSDSGVRFTTPAHSYDEVWTAAIRSVTRNLTILDENKAQGQIRAQSNAGLITGAQTLSVIISPAGRDVRSYLIEVRTSRSDNLFSGPDKTRNIVASIKAELSIMTDESPVSVKESLSPSEEVITMPLPDASQPVADSGDLAAQVERLARQSGCNPGTSATLIEKTAGVETYQTSCQNGQPALFKCELRLCRRVD